jgi:LysM repeat protein
MMAKYSAHQKVEKEQPNRTKNSRQQPTPAMTTFHAIDPMYLTQTDVVSLQRSIGNQRVNHLLKQKRGESVIQRQLLLGMTTSKKVDDAHYGWTSSYSLEITDAACQITINIKVNPDADVAAADVTRVQRITSNEFARYFDQRFNLVDANGVAIPLKVGLNFVDAGENLSLALHSGAGRDDLSNWFVDSEPIDRAHELGHQLGLKDEYVDATVPNRATNTSPGVSHDHAIMGNYYTEGIGEADVRQRHGDQLAGDISAASGMAFTAEFSDTYIVRRGDTLSSIALRIYNEASKWHEIFDLNKDKIKNPNLIFPNQSLQLPPRTP